MKRKIAILLASTLLLAGCGKKEAKQTQEDKTAEQLLARIGELEEENKRLREEYDIPEEPKNNEEVVDEIAEDGEKEDQAAPESQKKIDGEAKGAGTINLSTPGGEGPQVTLIVDPKTTISSIGLLAENVEVDGSEPTYVYIDGQESRKLQLSKDSMSQDSLELQGSLLDKGMHNVEIIQEIDGEQNFYRLLTYEVK